MRNLIKTVGKDKVINVFCSADKYIVIKNIEVIVMLLEQFRKADIILVCGLPGSGKSHFARKYFMKAGYKRVSRKEIRHNLYEMLNFGEKWSEAKFDLVDETLVKHIEKRVIEQLLLMKAKLIIDNLSISSSSRAAYIDIAKTTKKAISAIFINTDLATCLARNKEKPPEDIVPESIISNFIARVEFPERKEGFKDILVIEHYEKELQDKSSS
jgi:predicted kinase